MTPRFDEQPHVVALCAAAEAAHREQKRCRCSGCATCSTAGCAEQGAGHPTIGQGISLKWMQAIVGLCGSCTQTLAKRWRGRTTYADWSEPWTP